MSENVFAALSNFAFQAGSIFRVTGLGAGVKGLAMEKFPRETLEKLMAKR